jgi:transposase-like protein
MTYQPDFTLPAEILEQVADQGLDILPELIRLVFNSAMQAEREKYLGAAPYQRSTERRGHANGFKPKTIQTRIGEIQFDIPQVREGGFYPSALEKGLRSERALHLALAEMYLQGVSTRKVSAIIEQLCGSEVSSTQVSRAAKLLDEALQQWRERPLNECRYLFLDARYEKVRDNGQIRDVAVLIAAGVTPDGKRQILGVSVSVSEHEVHWRTFLHSLVARGLCGVQLIISDAHEGLKAARQAIFGGVPWQRCQFHLQQNAQAYVPRQELRAEVAADMRAIFNAPDRATAEAYLTRTMQKYSKSAPRLATWLESNLLEGFTVFGFPKSQQRRLRTVNVLERVNREIERRTRVVSIFPNESSCIRLISALLMEIDEAWQTGRIYLSMEKDAGNSSS